MYEENEVCMTERMKIHDFAMLHGGEVDGYVLHEGEAHPETYEELLVLMYQKFGIKDEEIGSAGLSRWILSGVTMEGSCSPDLDTAHAETIILIGELDDPDGYVASLPAEGRGLMLPPTEAIRTTLNQ